MAALTVHLAVHYATYFPPTRELVGDIPYFRLHALHEAEFLLLVFYAAVVFRLRGGLTALGVTAVTSVPFMMTPFIFGREPRVGEVRDLITQVGFILVMGLVMVLLYEVLAKERERRIALAAQLEDTNAQLQARYGNIKAANDELTMANRQLSGLNHMVQGQLNELYGDLFLSVDEERRSLDAWPEQHPLKAKFARFVQLVASKLAGGSKT